MSVKSPCVDVCRYNSNGLCQGCYRTKSEIMGWQNLTDEQKIQVLNLINRRKYDSGFISIDYDYYI